MKQTLTITCTLLAVGLMATVAPAATIEWEDGVGGSGSLAGTWANLPTAIDSAAGSAGTPGSVKVSGDLTRGALGSELQVQATFGLS